jgi:uncharacterized protein (TIRG00374 family)
MKSAAAVDRQDIVADLQPPRQRSRSHRGVAARAVLGIVGVALVVWAIAAKRDQLAGVPSALAGVEPLWIVAGVGAEILAVLAFADLQRRLLRAGGIEAGIVPLTGITFAGNALQYSLPGGGAFASVYAFRQFRRLGADDVLAGWTIVAVTVLSSLGLAFVGGLDLALADGDAAVRDVVGGLAGVALLAAAFTVLVRRGTVERWVCRVLRVSQRVTGRPRGRIAALVAETQQRLATVRPSKGQWAAGFGMATANWVWDCAALVASFLAVGAGVPWKGLLLAYGAAQLAANLPITPGGLGVVEGGLTVALVAAGGAKSPTIAAVLIYRLLSFWGLVLVGWVLMGAIAWRHRDRHEPRLQHAEV